MGKFDDDQRQDLQNIFAYGNVPDEDDFAAFIQAIADGIEYHEHTPSGGPGSGTGDAAFILPDLGERGIVPDSAIDNIDTWRKLLASQPYIARQAAPVRWRGTNTRGRTRSIIASGKFVYVGLLGSPAQVVEIDVATMETKGGWIGEEGQDNCCALAFDGTYLYAALRGKGSGGEDQGNGEEDQDGTSPAQVVKIASSSMTAVDTWVGEEGYDDCMALTYDGTHLYLGRPTDPASVVKIFPGTMHTHGVWETAPGWEGCQALTFDGLHLYIGLGTDPAKVIKIDPHALETLEVWVGGPHQRDVRALAFDGTYIYAGLYTAPAHVVKIDPIIMEEIDVWQGDSDQNWCTALLFDGEYVYVGTSLSASQIIQIETESMTTRCTWEDAGLSGQCRDPCGLCTGLAFNGLYILAAFKSYPARAIRFIMQPVIPRAVIHVAAISNNHSIFLGRLWADGSIDWIALIAGWPDDRYVDNCVSLVWDGDALLLAIGYHELSQSWGPVGLWRRAQALETPGWRDEVGGWEQITTLPDPVNDEGVEPPPTSSALHSGTLRKVGDTYYFTRYEPDEFRTWLYTSPDLSSWQSFQVHVDMFGYFFRPVERDGLVVLPGGSVLIPGRFYRAGSMRIPGGVGATVPYGAGMDFDSPFEICAWCKPDNWGDDNVILAREDVFELGMTGGNNEIYLRIWNKDGTENYYSMGGHYNAPAGEWSCHCFEIDGTYVRQVCRNTSSLWGWYDWWAPHAAHPAQNTNPLVCWVGGGGYLDWCAAGPINQVGDYWSYGFDEVSGDIALDNGPNRLHASLVDGELGYEGGYVPGAWPSYCGGIPNDLVVKWDSEAGLFTTVKLMPGGSPGSLWEDRGLAGIVQGADGNVYAFGYNPWEGNVFKSPDGGETWLPWGDFLDGDDYVATLLPTCDGALFAFSNGGQVWHLPVDGETWARKADLPMGSPVCSLEILAQKQYIFVGTNADDTVYGLVGSTDEAETWEAYGDDFPEGWEVEIWDLALCLR